MKKQLRKNKKFIKRLVTSEFSHEQLLFLKDILLYFRKNKISNLAKLFDECLRESKKMKRKFETTDTKVIYDYLSEEQIKLLYLNLKKDSKKSKNLIDKSYGELTKIYKKSYKKRR